MKIFRHAASFNIPLAITAIALLALPAIAQDQAEAPLDDGQFEGHALIRIDVQSTRELRAIMTVGAVPWSCRVNVGLQEFSVSPDQRAILDESDISYEMLFENVQRLFDEEREQIELARAQLGAGWFDVYRTWPEVNDYIDELVALRPDLVEKLMIGTSHEGRSIYGMRITAPGPPPNGGEKPGVLFNGCQHAREWISVMVPMYIADRLVRDFDSSPEIASILERVEFFIVPIVNPDGYEYTYASGGNRMWRKNRRNNGGGSFGVDLNRNWDIDWNGGNSTSTNPFSDIYVGPEPMSEPETQAMAAFIEEHPQIAAHIDFHNFSQMILQPWGFTNAPPPDAEVIDSLGAAMSQAIFEEHGISYPHGTPGQLLYFASGVFPDWSYDQFGVLGYTVELRPLTNPPGFLLPVDQILPTCEENFAAAMVMAEFTAQGISFTFVDPLPDTVAAGESTQINLNISPIASGPIDVASGQLFVRANDAEPFTPTPLTVSGDSFVAWLPPIDCGESLDFYFQISDDQGGTFTSPQEAPAVVYSVEAVDVLFADQFDEDLGWIVGADDDDATLGIWELANPVGTFVGNDPVQPSAPFVGSACYITGQHPGGGAGANDVDHGKTTLFTPVFDLSDADDAKVSYMRWYSNHAGANPFNDIFEVDISNDGGQTWVNVETVGPSGPEVMGGWYHHEFAISTLVTPTDQVQMRFVASDYDPQALVEAAIDAFRITRMTCDISCPEDLTGSGTVEIADLLVMLSAWGPCGEGGCPADLTGDHVVDVADLLLLLAAWGHCN